MPTNYTYTGQYSYTQDFGLMFYNARWLRSVPVGYDPTLGRFAQADSIVPPGVQGLDRYAYANNNPILFLDPSGHSSCVGDHWDDGPECAKREGSDLNIDIKIRTFINHNDFLEDLLPKEATGSNIDINFIIGVPIQTKTNGTAFLLFVSIGVVTDNRGNIQVYYTTLDQQYIPGGGGFVGDHGKENTAYGVGVSLTKGLIYGEGFTTDKFLGKRFVSSLPAGPYPATIGVFGPQGRKLNYTGYELGPSGGFSMGTAYTDTKDVFKIDLTDYIPGSVAIPMCQIILGLCGTP